MYILAKTKRGIITHLYTYTKYGSKTFDFNVLSTAYSQNTISKDFSCVDPHRNQTYKFGPHTKDKHLFIDRPFQKQR